MNSNINNRNKQLVEMLIADGKVSLGQSSTKTGVKQLRGWT